WRRAFPDQAGRSERTSCSVSLPWLFAPYITTRGRAFKSESLRSSWSMRSGTGLGDHDRAVTAAGCGALPSCSLVVGTLAVVSVIKQVVQFFALLMVRLQGRKQLRCECLDIGIFGVFGCIFKEIHGFFMGVDGYFVDVLIVKAGAFCLTQLFHQVLLIAFQFDGKLETLAFGQGLQLLVRLPVILDHHFSEFLYLGVLCLLYSQFTGLHFKQPAFAGLAQELLIVIGEFCGDGAVHQREAGGGA